VNDTPPDQPTPDEPADGLRDYVMPEQPPTSPPGPPTPPAPPAGASAAPIPPPAGDEQWWFDEPAHGTDPSGGGVADGQPRKRSAKTWVAVGAGVAALTAASVVGINVASSKMSTATAASATNGGPGGQFGGQGGPGGFGGQGGPGGGQGGTIASIDGSTITITTRDGSTAKVETSASTTVSKVVTGAVSDIKTGDNVTVMGTSTGDAAVTAARITDTGTVADAGFGGGQPPAGGELPSGQAPPDFAQGQGAPNAQNGQMPPQGQGGSAQGGNAGGPPGAGAGGFGGGMSRGTVAGIDGPTITVTTADGSTVTVSTDSSTTVSLRQAAALSDLAAGQTVQVRGTTGTDGTITATAITEGDVAFGGGAGRVGGYGQRQSNGTGAGTGNRQNRDGQGATTPTTA
jgi:hypothetical protein